MASPKPQAELLRAAGYVDVQEIDVTPDFLSTAKAWLQHGRRLEAGLREVMGGDEFEQLQSEAHQRIAALNEGLLRRSLLSATSPG